MQGRGVGEGGGGGGCRRRLLLLLVLLVQVVVLQLLLLLLLLLLCELHLQLPLLLPGLCATHRPSVRLGRAQLGCLPIGIRPQCCRLSGGDGGGRGGVRRGVGACSCEWGWGDLGGAA